LTGVSANACLMLTAGAALAASSPPDRHRVQSAKVQPVPPFTPIKTPSTDETLQVLISIRKQSMLVYSGERQIGFSPISSGKPGNETPHGIFSVLRKHKFRWSNLYAREPMPFMQRLTWSGIALHAGELPGYPASHGCVRMPDEFAKQLFELETRDRHVIIADTPANPVGVEHSGLFKPAANIEARKYAALTSLPPLRVLLTRLTGREKTLNAQKILNRLGFDAGTADGYVGRKTWRAIHNFQKSAQLLANGVLNNATYHALRTSSGAEDYPEGHLYVRQGYKPLFDTAIALKGAGEPLGAHLLTLPEEQVDQTSPQWLSVSLEHETSQAGLEAFLRFTIPDDVRERIEYRLGPNSSVAISDTGLGPETGKGTDFIVVTRQSG
jgi:hypothetical protein